MIGTLGVTTTTLTAPAIERGHEPIVLTKTLAIDAAARVKGTVLGKVTADGTYAPYVQLQFLVNPQDSVPAKPKRKAR